MTMWRWRAWRRQADPLRRVGPGHVPWWWRGSHNATSCVNNPSPAAFFIAITVGIATFGKEREMSLKQPYRMIAIDLDGTLLSPAGKVTERTKSAVHRCLSAGLLVCFATGRNWTESKTVLDAVAHYDTAVFVGGAMVIDTKHRVTLHRTMMQPQLAREVAGFFESRGHAALAMQDTASAGFDYVVSGELPLD